MCGVVADTYPTTLHIKHFDSVGFEQEETHNSNQLIIGQNGYTVVLAMCFVLSVRLASRVMPNTFHSALDVELCSPN